MTKNRHAREVYTVPLVSRLKRLLVRPHLRLIALVGVIVPRRLRRDWRQDWEAELRYREMLLAEWDRLDFRHKIDLLRRFLGCAAIATPTDRIATRGMKESV